jgi:polyribonucleotide nucleotidyltransferase
MTKEKTYQLDWAGRPLKVTITQKARQASGAVWLQYGETVVLATAVMSEQSRENIDYFPLLVDYDEKYYAAGRIKGSRFIKREGRPSDEAVLTARMIDRSLRPLFESQERRDVQVVVTVLAFDNDNDPDIPALLASSLALGVSDIPWNGPIGAVRLGYNTSGKLQINPTYKLREESDLDMVVVGSRGLISMIETGAKETAESKILETLKASQKELEKIEDFQNRIIKEAGQKKRARTPQEQLPAGLDKSIEKFIGDRLKKALLAPALNSKQLLRDLRQGLSEHLKTDFSEVSSGEIQRILDELLKKTLKDLILDKKQRPGGRKFYELRPLQAAVGLLPKVHGSGYFERGLTHTLSVITLGGPGEERWIEGMELVGTKRFMHHYNFPPFSVGEVRPLRFTSRREIGHGALVEKALEPVLPSEADFPYTIRIVTETLSSNGSTSMASVCSSSLALMDVGVPIKSAVAGVSMGVFYESPERFEVLTDIAGIEDQAGHMDFKIAGTRQGITALQLDVKVAGLPLKVLEQALQQGRQARLQILETIFRVIDKPRARLPEQVPRVITFKIDPAKIGEVIGGRGVVIREIIERTGAAVEVKDDGQVLITAPTSSAAQAAEDLIQRIVQPLEQGEEFEGEVAGVTDFGAFVEIAPGKEGLVHISELSSGYVKNANDVVKPGQIVRVRVIGKDERGRPRLSMKAVKESTS